MAENLVALLMLGVLAGLFVADVRSSLPHVAQVEALFMTARARVHWTETWANDGILPPESTAAYGDDVLAKYLFSLDPPRSDGGITFVFNDKFAELDGEAITVRPAFSDTSGAPFAIAWVCGASSPPPGYTLRGENLTTLRRDRLVAGCRKVL